MSTDVGPNVTVFDDCQKLLNAIGKCSTLTEKDIVEVSAVGMVTDGNV